MSGPRMNTEEDFTPETTESTEGRQQGRSAFPSVLSVVSVVKSSSVFIRGPDIGFSEGLVTLMATVRIGNGCGFWGDNLDAPLQLAQHGRLDYLTLEYLAELTMSILALQKQRNPEAGYASDFLDVLERLLPHLRAQPNLKIVTNAGGMNPLACAAKARALLERVGLGDRAVGVVHGDDLMPRLDELLGKGQLLAHIDTGQPLATIRDRVVSANVYLGARPIAMAL